MHLLLELGFAYNLCMISFDCFLLERFFACSFFLIPLSVWFSFFLILINACKTWIHLKPIYWQLPIALWSAGILKDLNIDLKMACLKSVNGTREMKKVDTLDTLIAHRLPEWVKSNLISPLLIFHLCEQQRITVAYICTWHFHENWPWLCILNADCADEDQLTKRRSTHNTLTPTRSWIKNWRQRNKISSIKIPVNFCCWKATARQHHYTVWCQPNYCNKKDQTNQWNNNNSNWTETPATNNAWRNRNVER